MDARAMVWLLAVGPVLLGRACAPRPRGPGATTAAAGSGKYGPLDARALPSERDAFREVLAQAPLVLGIGESHAQKEAAGAPSSTRRFREQLLPLLQGRASDIVVELWMADPACRTETEEVRRQQEQVTSAQAPTNKNEFLELAEDAKRLGIVPWPLRPTCEEYRSIASSGDEDMEKMLELTATIVSRTVERCLARNAGKGEEKIVAVYGGALHNDVSPPPGRGAWSFGPTLSEKTGGRYVELDVFVPEAIRDTHAWRELPWFSHYDPVRQRRQTTLYHPLPRSWVLILPTLRETP